MIHRGQETDAIKLLHCYVSSKKFDSSRHSGYSECGILYALGLIHANHGAVINDYLLRQLKDAHHQVNYI